MSLIVHCCFRILSEHVRAVQEPVHDSDMICFYGNAHNTKQDLFVALLSVTAKYSIAFFTFKCSFKTKHKANIKLHIKKLYELICFKALPFWLFINEVAMVKWLVLSVKYKFDKDQRIVLKVRNPLSS